MRKRFSARLVLVAAFLCSVAGEPQFVTAKTLEPIVYTVKIPAPETHFAEIEIEVPTGKRVSIDLMMAVWSPGFYRVEDYAGRVQSFSARGLDGTALQVGQPRRNRW